MGCPNPRFPAPSTQSLTFWNAFSQPHQPWTSLYQRAIASSMGHWSHGRSWKGQQQLISGKRKATGCNLAVLTDQNGNIEYISPPMPGRSHDKRIADKLGITTVLPGDYVTADLGYVGTDFDIP